MSDPEATADIAEAVWIVVVTVALAIGTLVWFAASIGALTW